MIQAVALLHLDAPSIKGVSILEQSEVPTRGTGQSVRLPPEVQRIHLIKRHVLRIQALGSGGNLPHEFSAHFVATNKFFNVGQSLVHWQTF
jgi:hypothetical protein